MTIHDMATKLGYAYSTKKSLVETNNGNYYSRTDHILTAKDDNKVILFRDRSSVQLFLESKAQLEIPATGGRNGPSKAR